MNEGLSQIVERLNDEQRHVVCSDLKNLLIVAGAGTGKTTVLVSRIAYLIEEKHISPYAILSVTFTNKAANEMKERLEKILGEGRTRHLWACTFHSACLRILRNFYLQASLKKDFMVIDTADQLRIVKKALAELGLEKSSDIKPKDYLYEIASCKELGLRPEHISTEVKLQRFADVYALYQSSCEQDGQVDFAEIILRTVELLRNNEDIRHFLHDKFSQILVDEFQDTNGLQYEWLRLISGKESNVLIVGDDDQSIYGWRGAVVENMHRFKSDFKNVELIELKRNYRSTNTILGIANSLIKNNRSRLIDKQLITDRETKNKVLVVETYNEYYQADFISKLIKKFITSGINGNDIAVLYRTNSQSRALEKQLKDAELKYVIYGGLRFYDREEIKNALSYLQLIVDPTNNLAFERILNVPARKIGKATLAKLQGIATETGLPLYDALKQTLLHSSSKPLKSFYELIEELKNDLKEATSIETFVTTVLEKTGLMTMYKAVDVKEGTSGESKSRYRNLEEFIKEFVLQENKDEPNYFSTTENEDAVLKSSEQDDKNIASQLKLFLDRVCLASTVDSSEEVGGNTAVRLMTVHCAKGLEFKIVIVAGFEETLMPLHPTEITLRELDEERRLAYVAITRAKDQLILCYAQNRNVFLAGGMISVRTGVSSFLEEMDKSFLERKVYKV